LKEVIYLKATKQDFINVNTFYNTQYGGHRTLSYWEQAYEINPMGKGMLFIAMINNLIVGIQGIIAYQFENGTKLVTTYKSEDSLVDARHRGKGIFSSLYKMVHVAVGNKLVWGFTDKKSVFERVGMPAETDLEIHYSIHRNWITSLNPFKIDKRKLLLSYVWAKSILSLATTKMYDNVELKNSWTTEFSEFVRQHKMDRYEPLISKNILDWRAQVSEGGSIQFGVERNESNDIRRIAILSIRNQEATILTWFSEKKVSPCKESISALKNILAKHNIFSLNIWSLSQRSNSNIYSKSGFTFKRKGMQLVSNSAKSDLKVNDISISALLSMA